MDQEESGGFFQEPETAPADSKVKEDCSLSLNADQNESCMYCKAVPVVFEIKKIFSIRVCSSCSRTNLKFITKTQCKSNYLLTEEELGEFRFLSRPNPHKGSWSDMILYLEKEIVDFSMRKHESIENIELIKIERKEKIKRGKIEKIKTKVKDLKRKTFLRAKEDKHKHAFVSKGDYSECNCGMRIDEEIL